MLSHPFFVLFATAKAASAAPAAETGGYLGAELGKLDAAAPAAQAPSLLPTLLNVAFSLAFVVGLVYVAYWLLLKWRNRSGVAPGPGKVGLIKVLERHFIDGRHGVAVVEVGDEVLTLGLGEDVTLLARVSDPETVEKLRQMAPLPVDLMGFKEQLQRVGVRLKREEWGQTKAAVKSQADELKEQVDRMRSRRGDR